MSGLKHRYNINIEPKTSIQYILRRHNHSLFFSYFKKDVRFFGPIKINVNLNIFHNFRVLINCYLNTLKGVFCWTLKIYTC